MFFLQLWLYGPASCSYLTNHNPEIQFNPVSALVFQIKSLSYNSFKCAKVSQTACENEKHYQWAQFIHSKFPLNVLLESNPGKTKLILWWKVRGKGKRRVRQHFQHVRFMSRGWKSSDRESIPAAVNNFAISSFYLSLSSSISRTLSPLNLLLRDPLTCRTKSRMFLWNVMTLKWETEAKTSSS